MTGFTLTVIVSAFVVVVAVNAREEAHRVIDQVLNETQAVLNEIQKQLDEEKKQ